MTLTTKEFRLFSFTLLVAILALSSVQSAHATWSPATRITSNAGFSAVPSIACSSNGQYVYMAWQDNTPGNFEIYFRRSTNYGASWGSALRITSTAAESGGPSVACSSNGRYVYLAWEDFTSGNLEIYFKRSTNYGVSWSGAARITSNSGESSSPDVACSSTGQYVYLAWEDWTPGNGEIYLKRSTNYGVNWAAAVRLTSTAGNSWGPSIACSSNGRYVYLAWHEWTPGNEIYFKRSNNYGVSWAATLRITSNTGDSVSASIACSSIGEYVYLAWADDTPGNYEIYFKRGTNYGVSWSSATRITINTGLSTFPSVVSSLTGQYVYLTWEDSTPGNHEIYFRKSNNYGT